MPTDTPRTTRRTVLTGVAGALAFAGVTGAQETTTSGGEEAAGGSTTTAGGTATAGESTTTAARGETVTFSVRIVNVSGPDALTPSGGEPQPVVVSPGVYAVHTSRDPLFTPEQPDRGEGLEALAEDGDPTQLADSLDGKRGIVASGVFDTPVAGGEPGPLGPGDAYGFRVAAARGDRLSFATMFVPSNDLFFAPIPSGVPLFRRGGAVSGDVTSRVALWDAGTERNEEPGAGPNQAPRQPEPNTGPDENAPVRRVQGVDDGYEYPSVADVLQVLVVPEGGNVTPRTTEAGATTTAGTETETTSR